MLKSLIPYSLKLNFRLLKRHLTDKSIDFATKTESNIDFNFKIATSQEIKKGAFYENKIHNLKVGALKIEKLIIYPNQVFSFWKSIKSPSKKNNFKKGRNIIKGKVSEEIGGGLCQLSSIIYLTALKSGIEIIERFNHSVDIYKEEDRFTPLGADATVVYGYKDLRLKNNYNFPITFSIIFYENNILCYLKSTEKIEENEVDFIRNYNENNINVSTMINRIDTYKSFYKKTN